MSTILVFFDVFWFESYPLLCDQGDPKCSTLLCSHNHMYTILYVAVLYTAWTNSTSTTAVYNIKAKLLRRYHIVRERERDEHVTRRERNEFIFLQSVAAWPGGTCRHGFQDEGQHNGRCMVGTVGLGLAPPSTLGESETWWFLGVDVTLCDADTPYYWDDWMVH